MIGKWTKAHVKGVIGALLLIPLLAWAASHVQAAERAIAIPAPAVDETASASGQLETVVLAGGCFWGVQGGV